MVSNTTLVEYYERHKTDYPVIFSAIDNGIVMWSDAKETESIAYLENSMYEVFPSDEIPRMFIRSLKEDALAHHLEYDEDDPQLVLDAFLDCTYLRLNRIRNDVVRLMNIIEGRRE